MRDSCGILASVRALHCHAFICTLTRLGDPLLWPLVGPGPRLTPCSFPRSSRCLQLSRQMCVATWTTGTYAMSSRTAKRKTRRRSWASTSSREKEQTLGFRATGGEPL